MKINLKKKIGSSVFEFDFEEGKLKDALFFAAGITSIPTICSICGSDHIQLESNKAEKDGKTYKYVKVRCLSCMAASTMGENIDGINVFWKKFEKFEKKQDDSVPF